MVLKRIKSLRINYPMAIVMGVFLAGLLGFTTYRLLYQIRISTNDTIVRDVARLEQIFLEIDAACEITAVAHDRNYIDFLQVKTFTGSNIGPLRLKYPEKWRGPYVDQNPEVQGKLYELVKVKNGYALVPGQGVKLANGAIMGTDIKLTTTTDLDAFVNEKSGLEWQGKPLARLVQLRAFSTAPFIDELADNEI